MSFGSSAECTTGMDSIFPPRDALRELEPLSPNTHMAQSRAQAMYDEYTLWDYTLSTISYSIVDC